MNVIFVTMPFGSIRPAIGVSLLKGQLERMGIESTVAYLNVGFAARMGLDPYLFVSDVAPNQLLLGDWIFSSCLRDASFGAEQGYIDMVMGWPASPGSVACTGSGTRLSRRLPGERRLGEL
jgi:hypothetical protein